MLFTQRELEDAASKQNCFELLKSALIVLRTVAGCTGCESCRDLAKMALEAIHGPDPVEKLDSRRDP